MAASSSLLKALDLITFLTGHPEGARLRDIVAGAGLPRPTVLWHLQSLATYGLVEKCGRGYRLTERFYIWSSRDRNARLKARYRPVLEQIQRTTGELVLLGLQEGNAIIHVDYLESDHAVRVAPAPVTRHDLTTSALGKLALSRTPHLRKAVMESHLKAELEAIDCVDPAWNREESNPGVIAMATWGFSRAPSEPMLAVAWPKMRFTEDRGTRALDAIRDALADARTGVG